MDPADPQSAWLTLPDMEFANRVLDRRRPRHYQGRKGIEPAGAKGVFILEEPVPAGEGLISIENIITRQRREDLLEKGVHRGVIEKTFVYPMLGGRNIERWAIKSNEYMLVPHTAEHKYGVPEDELERTAPKTLEWLDYFHEGLLASRIQNGKFFNVELHPFYRLDNVGTYTYAPYKVLWKEQTGSMSAVTVGAYSSIPGVPEELFPADKPIVVDSKVLMLALEEEEEAYYVSGVLNAPSIRQVIDGYAISTNRGIDVLKYIAVPKYDPGQELHIQIAALSKRLHRLAGESSRDQKEIEQGEAALSKLVHQMFMQS